MGAELLSDYLDENAAAAALHVCTKTLRRWRALGDGPPMTRLGRKVLFRRTAIAEWLAAKEAAVRRKPAAR